MKERQQRLPLHPPSLITNHYFLGGRYMKRFLGLFVCLLFAFCVNAQVVQPPISTIPIGPPPVAPAYLQVQMWGSGAVNDGTTPLIPGMFYRFNIQQDAMTTVYVTWSINSDRFKVKRSTLPYLQAALP